MSISDSARIDALFKKFQGRTNTGSANALGTEPISVAGFYSEKQLYSQPVPPDHATYLANPSSYPWVSAITNTSCDIVFNQFASNGYKTFRKDLINKIIPFYPIIVKADGAELAAQQYILDFEAGNLVVYYNASTLTISCYIYTGTVGNNPTRLTVSGDTVAVSVDGSGRIGIGTTTPEKTLDVSGTVAISGQTRVGKNLILGTNPDIPMIGAGYSNLQLSGGNSGGFLFGAFNGIGDGIHMSYNYMNDNSANRIINSGGGTSRISAQYQQIELAVGSTNTIPTSVVTVNTGAATVAGTLTASEFKSSNYGKQFARLSHSQNVNYTGGTCVFDTVTSTQFLSGYQQFLINTPGIYLFTLNFNPTDPGPYGGKSLQLRMMNNDGSNDTLISWLYGLNYSQSASAVVEITSTYNTFYVTPGSVAVTINANNLILTVNRLL